MQIYIHTHIYVHVRIYTYSYICICSTFDFNMSASGLEINTVLARGMNDDERAAYLTNKMIKEVCLV